MIQVDRIHQPLNHRIPLVGVCNPEGVVGSDHDGVLSTPTQMFQDSQDRVRDPVDLRKKRLSDNSYAHTLTLPLTPLRGSSDAFSAQLMLNYSASDQLARPKSWGDRHLMVTCRASSIHIRPVGEGEAAPAW